jgi:hypothetical protein
MRRLQSWAEARDLWAFQVVEVGGDAWEGHDEAGVGLHGGDPVTEKVTIIAAWADKALARLTAGWDLRDATVDAVASEELARWQADWDAYEAFRTNKVFSPLGPARIVWDERAREVRVERVGHGQTRVIARADWDPFHQRDAQFLDRGWALPNGRALPSCIRALMTDRVLARLRRLPDAIKRLEARRAWRAERANIRARWRAWYVRPVRGPKKALSPRGEALVAKIFAAQDRAVQLAREREQARRAAEEARRAETAALQPASGPARPEAPRQAGSGGARRREWVNNPFAELL